MTLADIAHFAQAHRGDDPVRLLLNRHRHPGVDMPLVAQQLEAYATAPAKWPTLAACPEVLFPPRLNREQSSSEATARYKASLADPATDAAADLTGGMGIDSLFLARRVRQMHYCEQDETLCRLAEHNFAALGQDNIAVHPGDSLQWLRRQPEDSLGTLAVDPARRDSRGSRVAAFDECTPDILPLLPLLRSRARRVIIKASPMLDISTALRQLGDVAEVHVVALDGECKELLFLLDGDSVPHASPTRMVCADIQSPPTDPLTLRSLHRFTLAGEQAAVCPLADTPQRYLYEPNAALMKGGCYRLVGQWYGLAALDRNSHLYTSDSPVDDFPGRAFEILAAAAPTAKGLRHHFPDGRAHVVCRNFPLRADLLQKQLRLREGGDLFLVATTLRGRHTALVCRPLPANPPKKHLETD